ncbi:MAG: OmpH family outer membrane protein [Phycisphaerales bacterium]
MSRKVQTMTLGLALAAAGFAGAAFVQQADAVRDSHAAEHGIAFVDVFGLIDEIIQGEEYETARTEFDNVQQTQLGQMQGQMQALQAQLQLADPNAPETQALYGQGQQLQQQMQQFYQSYQEQMQQLIGTQIAEAYKIVYTAAGEESAEQGIHFLFATRPGSDLLVDSLSGVAQEILARPLIAPADSLDLTGAVRERLGLPEPTDEEAGIELETIEITPVEVDEPETQPADPMGEGG